MKDSKSQSNLYLVVQNIQKDLDSIKQDTFKLRQLHRQVLSYPPTNTNNNNNNINNNSNTSKVNNKHLYNQIDSLTESISALIQSCRLQIKNLKTLNNKNISSKNNNHNNYHDDDGFNDTHHAKEDNSRIIETQQRQLATRLIQTSTEFQAVQQEARRNYRNMTERQYKIVHPTATSEEIQFILDGEPHHNYNNNSYYHGDGKQGRGATSGRNGQIFQQELMNSKIREHQLILDQVRDRNHEILKIEQSIEELFQLFQDMHFLIENQQVLVDDVDNHVQKTVAHLEQGSTALTAAVKSAKRSRKRKWMLSCCCLVLLIIIACVLIFKVFKVEIFGKNKNNSNNNNNNNNQQ